MSAALEKRKEAEPAPAVDVEGPRRSQRLLTQADHSRLQAELEQCRLELAARTQGEPGAELVCGAAFSFYWSMLTVCCSSSLLAELRRLKMQLEVPGPTGALTGAADRKLEEGQRVGVLNCCRRETRRRLECLRCGFSSLLKDPSSAACGSAEARE